MVIFIHRVKFLCVSSIGVTTNQAFWIYVCINTQLLQLFPSRILRDFFLFACFSSKKSEILFLGTGLAAFALVMFSLSTHHIFSTSSSRVSEVDVTFPFNQRRWIRGTVQLLQKEESWARKGRAQSSWAASCWLRHSLLLLTRSMGHREFVFQWTWIPGQKLI